METKLLFVEWNPILPQIGYTKFVAVDCDCATGGHKGGLCILWADDIKLDVKSSSLHHILASIDDGIHEPWDFCGLYGWSNTEEHSLTWDLMRVLKTQVLERWICGGDFNETMYHFEKRGGQIKPDLRLVRFRDVVEECGLSDLGFVGNPFTWNNNQVGEANIMERLDRVLGSDSWIHLFPSFEVSHLLRKSSDHCPVVLCLEKICDERSFRPKPFRFEAMWLKHESFKETCERLWESGGVVKTAEEVKKKIDDIGYALKLWEKMNLEMLKSDALRLEKRWMNFKMLVSMRRTGTHKKKLEDELDELSKKEELMWKQRSKADWLAEGDRNTGFFHKVAEGRKKRNHIREIKCVDGTTTQNFEKMNEIFRDHFQTLFSPGQTHNPSEVLRSIDSVVTEEMNRELTRPYTTAEIVAALKQMHPLKAPGPMIVSKVITNRLKVCLHSIIHESQSAFVPGRHITDNALLAFEIFHMMKLNKANSKGVFAFKLDMAKAYDRVEWNFSESIMLHLGFCSSFVRLILRCVSTVSFRVLVNGCPGTSFEPGRGLRQGDPLSPFLFLFCAEALSGLLRKAETQNLLHGARICRTAPRVSHLLFANDCIIFGRRKASEVEEVKKIINSYEGVSGQLVNLDKSSISFSSGILEGLQIELASILGVVRSGQRSTYLGIPCTVGRSKSEIFQMLVDRTRKKSKDWKRRYMSGAGKMARYFPRNDLLMANNAHNPSYAWKSLLAGHDLIEKGIAWRLGNGNRIRIGKDCWLPNGKGQFTPARVGDSAANLRVRDLIESDEYC
ncbi:uncharacterized protein LOC130994097 [Salvia miltiorrhiza]|uniref:uncharacterized protein LOC130994097 n=1 Tax=Salvia miltiorrhiza TaxID=226208 RepID=UPI0025AC19C3|nr:uncharacterized protein LOC130994097 [Salvia miltiorrhiza]